MVQPPYQIQETKITGLKIPFGDIFVLVGKVYAAVLVWALIIGAIGGAIALVLSLIIGVGLGSLLSS